MIRYDTKIYDCDALGVIRYDTKISVGETKGLSIHHPILMNLLNRSPLEKNQSAYRNSPPPSIPSTSTEVYALTLAMSQHLRKHSCNFNSPIHQMMKELF